MFTQQRVGVNEGLVQTGFISNIGSLIGFTNWIPSYIFEAKVCYSAGILFLHMELSSEPTALPLLNLFLHYFQYIQQ